MKILLLGKNGQVGWQLQRALAPLGEIVALERKDAGGDLADPQGLAAAVRAAKPQVIVNAAAYTAVDKAESEPQLARLINTEAPAALAREAAASGALLVHYSTDYVFDGSGSAPWQESDATGPLNVYGATKLAGEQAIAASGCAHLTFRTSWVYAAHGDNFIKTMLRLAATRERLTVIDDQKGAPTGAELIADVTAHAISQTLQQPAKAGLYHLTAAGEASWFDYAQYVLALARQARPQGVKTAAGGVQPIASSQYPAAARRPLNSRLDTRRLQAAFGLQMPPWQQGVTRVLREILESKGIA
ncbi:dTDP-4-dehydrorhamnose reductase [Ottowia sp. oral taxon 894]|jgi:dTDP-4-dehydrorhamnose reductase|uniref:dTDP-4-dehydrorhamnose reductase n=1 Tax=Ottowia sp. oral taxon 894 TaxID=1658672 RepID=UPI0006805C78|nr:dTDP-4-dehydrorhamnose reductase [Ottowia sp. oral taxon 894]AKU67157.1 dTDP-4-dehydrorhamnose reductase [Ottowia sp. oral taxon 894]